MNSTSRKVMKAIRVTVRLCRLGAELMMAACLLVIHGAKAAASPAGSHHRALWLHHLCRRLRPIFGVELNAIGPVPARGLLVANHLSYLDIIVLASLTPCVFVAKSEVQSWPVFGWFARRAGTIFINRRSRRDAVRATEEIRAALDAGALVVLFPEGTSSDGAAVRAFKSSLLEAAGGETPNPKSQIPNKFQTPNSKAVTPISVAALHYEVSDGEAAQDVCYWGDHTLVPHLLKLLSKRGVQAALSFAEVGNTGRDRKRLAAQLHAEVSALHAGLHTGASSAPAGQDAFDISTHPKEPSRRFGADGDWDLNPRPPQIPGKPAGLSRVQGAN